MADIHISFPQAEFDTYLLKARVTSSNRLTVETINQVFLLIVAGFKEGAISVEQLAIMSGRLLERINQIGKYDSEMGYVLDDASELHFYVRQIQDTICAQTFVEDLRRTLDYFDKNKYLIEPLLQRDAQM